MLNQSPKLKRNNLVISNLSIIVQSEPSSSLSIAAIGALGAVLGALAGGYATYRLEKLKLNNNEFEKQQQLYGRLGGLERTLSQIYSMCYETKLYSKYHRHKWINSGCPDNSSDQKKSEEFYQKSYDLTHEITEVEQNLFETLNTIRLQFKNTDDLNNLVERFESIENVFNDKFSDMQIPANLNDLQLTKWVDGKVDELMTTISDEISIPLKNLQDYLRSEINKEAKKPRRRVKRKSPVYREEGLQANALQCGQDAQQPRQRPAKR